jgi:hypothetical protein
MTDNNLRTKQRSLMHLLWPLNNTNWIILRKQIHLSITNTKKGGWCIYVCKLQEKYARNVIPQLPSATLLPNPRSLWCRTTRTPVLTVTLFTTLRIQSLAIICSRWKICDSLICVKKLLYRSNYITHIFHTIINSNSAAHTAVINGRG